MQYYIPNSSNHKDNRLHNYLNNNNVLFYALQDSLKRWDFEDSLTDVSVFDDRIWQRRLFQADGAANKKVSDQVSVCVQREDREWKYQKKSVAGGLICT